MCKAPQLRAATLKAEQLLTLSSQVQLYAHDQCSTKQQTTEQCGSTLTNQTQLAHEPGHWVQVYKSVDQAEMVSLNLEGALGAADCLQRLRQLTNRHTYSRVSRSQDKPLLLQLPWTHRAHLMCATHPAARLPASAGTEKHCSVIQDSGVGQKPLATADGSACVCCAKHCHGVTPQHHTY
jgi:hypothetical protein